MVNKLCICWSENFDIIEMHGATTKIRTDKIYYCEMYMHF
jgi:hypothetical protein